MVTDDAADDVGAEALCFAPASKFRVLGLHRVTQAVWCIDDCATVEDAERVRRAYATDVVMAHIVDDRGRHRCTPQKEEPVERVRLLSFGRYRARNGERPIDAVYALLTPHHCYLRFSRGAAPRDERTLLRVLNRIAQREGCKTSALQFFVVPARLSPSRSVPSLRVDADAGLVHSRTPCNERALAFLWRLAVVMNGRRHS